MCPRFHTRGCQVLGDSGFMMGSGHGLIERGTVFAVPLREEGFAIGVAARLGRTGVCLAYFFGPRLPVVPDGGQVAALEADAAVLVALCGDADLRGGRWQVVGRVARWRNSDWPMPVFVRKEEISGRTFRVLYDEQDPGSPPREERLPAGAMAYGLQDRLMGGGSVERTLTRLLSP